MAEKSKNHQAKDQLDAEAAAAKKDPARLEVLYNRYYEQIFSYLYQRLDSKEQVNFGFEFYYKTQLI